LFPHRFLRSIWLLLAVAAAAVTTTTTKVVEVVALVVCLQDQRHTKSILHTLSPLEGAETVVLLDRTRERMARTLCLIRSPQLVVAAVLLAHLEAAWQFITVSVVVLVVAQLGWEQAVQGHQGKATRVVTLVL
jgi:hypothetical protein